MKGNTILTQTSPEDLAKLITDGIQKHLEDLKNDLLAKDANDDLLTREEACKFLQIDPSTLWHWQNRGKVTAYSISGTRRYYKRSELLDALKPLKK